MSVAASDRSRLTVGLIGAGQVGQHHAAAFRQLPAEVDIIGVADVDEERAVAMAETCSAQAFTDYRDLLELTPDISVICVPHHLHREIGLAAAAAGSHVLMEKPLAHTLGDAYAIVEGCRRHGARLTVSFVHRFRKEFQQAYQIIDEGQLGDIAMAIDHFCFPGGGNVPPWVWQKRYSGGGILMYSGIHSVDRLRWFLQSEVTEVFARTMTYTQTMDVEDGLVAILTFANGCTANLIETQPAYRVSHRTRDTEVFGSQARLRIRSGDFLEYASDSEAYRLEIVHGDHFLAQAREFVAAVRDDREPWITGEDGLQAQKIVTAIYHSAETGRVVAIDDVRA